MNALQHTWPIKLCCEAWLLGGGRLLTDRRTGGGDARFPNGDVDRNSIVSQHITGGSLHALTQQYLDRTDVQTDAGIAVTS